MLNLKKRFYLNFSVLFLLTALVFGLSSCTAKNGGASEISETSDAYVEMNIAERMKNLLESEQSEQAEQTELPELTELTEHTIISTSESSPTEIISNTLPYTTYSDEINKTEESGNITELPELSEIPETSETSENITDLYVITPSGKKYHYPNCRTVKNIKAHLTKEDAESQGYESCKICKPK